MKRIGILSDTHSCRDSRYAKYFSECDEIWHAGDIGDIRLLEELEAIGPRVRAVCGNIDSVEVRRRCRELEIFNVEGVNVLLTHIGGYPGHYSHGIRELLAEKRIGLMVCGHSHILKVMPDVSLGLLHVNPGAAGLQGWHTRRTLVRLTLDAAAPQPIGSLEVIELEEPRSHMKSRPIR